MKIGFGFLIYDRIEQDELWLKYVKDKSCEIRIHAKFDTKLHDTFKPYCIDSIPTQYRKISIVKANLLLLESLFTETDVSCVILLSGSCFPIESYNTIEQSLVDEPQSRFADLTYNRNNHIYDRCSKLTEPIIKKEEFKKQQTNCIIFREDYDKLMPHMEYFLNVFKHVDTPEEHFFINMFRYYNISYIPRVVCMAHKQQCMAQAYDIPKVTKEYVMIAKKRRAFFIRKVRHNAIIPEFVNSLLGL